jgi:hypothetical protein
MRVTLSSVDGQVLDTFSLSSYIALIKEGKKKDWLGVTPFLKNKEKEKVCFHTVYLLEGWKKGEVISIGMISCMK